MNRTLTHEEYTAIQAFLEGRAGIRLGDGKEYLVISRLGRLLQRFEMAGFRELAGRLNGADDRVLQTAVIDAMTTNETFWFRDVAHFNALVEVILPEHRHDRMRIWSAASSTGQEAYTAAICLQDAIRSGRINRNLTYEIVGTDISEAAIQEARGGVYCGVSAGRGLTEGQQRRYFRTGDGCIEILPQYRRDISFRTFNLLQPYDGLGRFDFIFCRNVLIYFSQARKKDIVERMVRALKPGGHLFLGSTESLNGYEDRFEMRHIAGGLVYRLRG